MNEVAKIVAIAVVITVGVLFMALCGALGIELIRWVAR